MADRTQPFCLSPLSLSQPPVVCFAVVARVVRFRGNVLCHGLFLRHRRIKNTAVIIISEMPIAMMGMTTWLPILVSILLPPIVFLVPPIVSVFHEDLSASGAFPFYYLAPAVFVDTWLPHF